jgi:modulator of FtsH protease
MNSGYNSRNQGPFMESTWNNTPVAQSSAAVQLNFIRKTYLLFMAGILSAVVGGVLCLNVAPVAAFAGIVLSNVWLALLVIVGGSFAAQAVARTPGLNYVALFGFTSLIGIVFTPIIAIYAPAVVGQAAFLSIVVFGSLTAYAFVTRKDFSFMGGILFVGMLTIVLGSAANALFFKNWGATYWIAWATLFMSGGFVLYQTSNIIHEYSERDTVAAALGLFISFFNIFMSLLRILGGNRN